MNKNKKTSLSIILVAVIIAIPLYFKDKVLSLDSTLSPLYTSIGLGFIFVCLLFLVCREILTWYWKINKAISLLEKIEENTRK